MMKKLLTLLLTAALCLSCLTFVTPWASAVSQEETNKAAAVLNMMGAIEGDGSGGLGLDNTLTRAQFCKIAIVAMGLSEKVGQYAGYTIYPDVLTSDWEVGYVNAAVRYAAIMSGFADGTFRPDELITYAQAVTVLVRMLGYTDSDVGASWPDGYLEKAGELGLTAGFSLSAGDSLTKGQMAVLFVNMLSTEVNGSTQTFVETLPGATVIKNVFLVSANAETDNGTSGALKVTGASGGTYLPVNDVPDALLGAYGSLVLNSAGKALTFVPAGSGRTVTSTITSVSSESIKYAGGTISPTASTTVYMDDAVTTYSSAWSDLSAGMRVSAYYDDGGAVQYILVYSVSSGETNVTVVTTDSYSLPAGTAVYINGNAAKASDIIKYDVLVSDEDYETWYVSRNAISGRIESFEGSAKLPSSVTMLGLSFEVLDSAASDFSQFKLGSVATLLLTTDGKVAAAIPQFKYSAVNYGIVQNLSGSSATVKLLSGYTVTGAISYLSSEDVVKGSFVIVTSPETGTLSMYNLSDYETNWPLDLETGKLGLSSLSVVVRIFDTVGGSSATEIELSDIIGGSVPSYLIKRALYDSSGKVSLLLLDDVTGDAYTYGFANTSTSSDGTSTAISVVNSNGTSDAGTGYRTFKAGTVLGIAVAGDGTLAGYVDLTALSGLTRESFKTYSEDMMYITVDAGLMRVSDNVQVYVDATGQWTTLDEAMSYSDSFTAYYDRTPETGGKVRVIIAY